MGITVRQIKSEIGETQKVRRVLTGLGLRGIGSERKHKDNNCIRGMINRVSHLVAYDLG